MCFSLPLTLCFQACLCIFCQGGLKKRSPGIAKTLYLGIMFLHIVISLLLKKLATQLANLESKIFFNLPAVSFTKYCEGSILKEQCYENQVVYRLGFASAAFFLPLLLLSFTSKKFVDTLHRGGFGIKFFLFFAFIIASFFLPPPFVHSFSNIAKYIAPLFILIQLISLIDFSYAWNSNWVANYEATGNSFWLVAVLAIAGVSLLAGLGFSLFGALHFSDRRVSIPMIMNLIASCINTAVSLSSIAPHGTLLTSGLITAYSTYTLWSNASALPSDTVYVSNTANLVIGVILMGISITWTCSTLSGKSDLMHATSAEEEEEEDQEEKREGRRGENEAGSARDYRALSSGQEGTSMHEVQWFYLVFLFAIFYITMLGSNWGTESSKLVGKSLVVYWIGLATTGLLQLIYAWTLWAPFFFPERDFGHAS